MKQIMLPFSNLEVEVKDDVYYFFDGEVDDVELHRRKLFKKYNYSPTEKGFVNSICASRLYEIIHKHVFRGEYKRKGSYVYLSLNLENEDKERKDVIVFNNFFSKDNADINKIFCVGHEQGHFVLLESDFNIVKDKYNDMGYDGDALDNLSEEGKCHAVGLLALMNEYEKIKLRNNDLPELDFFLWVAENKIKDVEIVSGDVYF